MVVREFADAFEVQHEAGTHKLQPGELPPGWLADDWSNLPSGGTEDDKAKASIERYAFNAYRSSRLPLSRPVHDARTAACKAQIFPDNLPQTSVIICFVDEMWSTLMRTVHSVLRTIPAHLLKEIVLVDDASPANWLKEVRTRRCEGCRRRGIVGIKLAIVSWRKLLT